MDSLARFLKSVHPFSESDLEMGLAYFRHETYTKGDFYLQENHFSNRISFIDQGLFRLFYQVDSEEKIMLFFHEHQFMTDYFGFLTKTPSIRPIQALEDSTVYSIERNDLNTLYERSKTWEHVGRILAESAYVTSVLRANRLLHDDFDTRFKTFLEESPSLLQRVPQYMIASFLNMTPETLSRVKKRIMNKSGVKKTIHRGV